MPTATTASDANEVVAGAAGFHTDPTAYYERLQDAPELFELRAGLWACRSHPVAVRTLASHSFAVTAASAAPAPAVVRTLRESWVEVLDGEQHRRIRRMLGDAIGPTFQPPPGLVQRIDGLLPEGGTVELVSAVVTPVLEQVLLSWFGFDAATLMELSPHLGVLAAIVAATGAPDDEQIAAAESVLTRLTAAVETAAVTRPDSFPGAVAREAHGARAAAVHLANLLVDSAPVGAACAAVLAAAAGDAVVRAAVSRGEAPVAAVVEETLRLDPVQLLIVRTAGCDVETEFGTIPDGARVVVLTGAANRDRTVFPEPGSFRPERHNRSLAFGSGAHTCLGRTAVLDLASAVLHAVVTRFPDVTLAAPVRWAPQPVVRQPLRIDVSLGIPAPG